MKLGSNWKKILKENIGHLKVFFLIGPPSVGKSHWLENEGPQYGIENPYKISMDDVTDSVGDRHGFSYDDMFEAPIQPGQPGYSENQYSEKYGEMVDQPLAWKTWQPKVWSKVAAAAGEAMEDHDRIVKAARDSGRPIVVDMTNMNKAGRDRMKQALDAPDHEMVAVIFDWNDDVDFLKKSALERNQKRIKNTGRSKTIPPEAFDRMIGSYQPPEEGEFDEVIHVSAWWAK